MLGNLAPERRVLEAGLIREATSGPAGSGDRGERRERMSCSPGQGCTNSSYPERADTGIGPDGRRCGSTRSNSLKLQPANRTLCPRSTERADAFSSPSHLRTGRAIRLRRDALRQLDRGRNSRRVLSRNRAPSGATVACSWRAVTPDGSSGPFLFGQDARAVPALPLNLVVSPAPGLSGARAVVAALVRQRQEADTPEDRALVLMRCTPMLPLGIDQLRRL